MTNEENNGKEEQQAFTLTDFNGQARLVSAYRHMALMHLIKEAAKHPEPSKRLLTVSHLAKVCFGRISPTAIKMMRSRIGRFIRWALMQNPPRLIEPEYDAKQHGAISGIRYFVARDSADIQDAENRIEYYRARKTYSDVQYQLALKAIEAAKTEAAARIAAN